MERSGRDRAVNSLAHEVVGQAARYSADAGEGREFLASTMAAVWELATQRGLVPGAYGNLVDLLEDVQHIVALGEEG